MLKGFQLNRSVSKNSERQIQQNWRQNSSLPSPGLVLHFGSHTKYNRVWWDSLWKTTTWQNPADWWAFPLQLYTLFIGTGFHSLQMRGTSPSEMLSSKGLCPPLWFSSSLGHPIWFGQILLLFLNQSSWHENFTTKRPTLKQRLKIVVRLPATEHLLRSLLVMPLPVNHKNAVVTILTASCQKATEIKGSTASYPQTFSILTADEHLNHHTLQLHTQVTALGQDSGFVCQPCLCAQDIVPWHQLAQRPLEGSFQLQSAHTPALI